MNIAENILRHHFQNVYVITGHACGGKTTTSRYLAEKHECILFNWDDMHAELQALAEPEYQPEMSKRPSFESWEAYFMRPPAEYNRWIDQTFVEQTDMVIVNLIKIIGQHPNKKIIVDGFFTIDVLQRLFDYNRVFFLLASEEVIRHDYFNRDCKRDMYDCIMGLSNPVAALDNVFATMFYNGEVKEQLIKDSGFRWSKRETLGTNQMDTIKMVEQHFGLI